MDCSSLELCSALQVTAISNSEEKAMGYGVEGVPRHAISQQM